MQTLVTIDEQLFKQAKAFTGLQEQSALMNEALQALVQRESAHRLANLGGTQPELENNSTSKGKDKNAWTVLRSYFEDVPAPSCEAEELKIPDRKVDMALERPPECFE